jgi:uroporphyrinogen decarboxylase
VRDYPCEAISFADRSPKNPTLTQMRGLSDKCLMGGLDETTIQEKPLADLRAQIDDAFAQAGRRKFILAPGCTVPSFTPRRTLACLREYTR